MEDYLKGLNSPQIKDLIRLYDTKHKLTGLKRDELSNILKALMLDKNSKYKCLAKCKKGHCNCWYTKQNDLTGAGLLDLFKRPKKVYSNSARRTLEKFGNYSIKSLQVIRTPILSVLDRIINIISFGKFNKLKNKYNYDDLFHLQLQAQVDVNGVMKAITIEKNEVINISPKTATKQTSQIMNIPISQNLTLNTLLDNAQKAVGPAKYFLYDPFKNNCQDWIIIILKSNNLLNAQSEKFIKQDITQIAQGLPDHVKKAMGITTELGARIAHAIGAGRQTNEYWSKNSSDFWNKQNNIRNDLLKENEKQNAGKVSELDKYKAEQIKRVEDEMAEYQRTHGHSGNFFTDINYGVKTAKSKYFDPVKSVVDKAAPVINMIPGGKAFTTSLNAFDKAANTYNAATGSGVRMNPKLLLKFHQ